MDGERTVERRFFTVEQAADLLECSGQTIRRRINDGELRAYRLGPRSTVISVEDVEEYIAANEVVATK